MDFVRVFTDEAGLACIEDLDVLNLDDWRAGVKAQTCQVRQVAAGTVMDWHNAPRRQLAIHLSGSLEIVLRDGSTRKLGPGSARLMDDLTGSGHMLRIGDEPVTQVMIVLE